MKDILENKAIEMIKDIFDESRHVTGFAPEEMGELENRNLDSEKLFITDEGELIYLERQTVDFDEVELVNYIEIAEGLYKKNNVFISIYVICDRTINISVPECSIKSNANFTIRLASLKPNPAYNELSRIKEKVDNNIKLNDEDEEMLSMIPMMGDEKDIRNLRIECLRLLKKSRMH